jgi:hypothetical protein
MTRPAGPLARLLARCALWRADFVVIAQPGRRTLVRGRIPRSRVGAIEAFFDQDLRPASPVRVRGSWVDKRTLRLRIGGQLDPGQGQRVRNFLHDLLG